MSDYRTPRGRCPRWRRVRFRHGIAVVALSCLTHLAVAAPRVIPLPLPGHPGHIFTRGEIVTVARPETAGSTGWVCLDYEQQTVAAGTGAEATLGRLPVGYYEVWATDAAGHRLAKTTLGMVEPLRAPTPGDSPIGLDVAAAWFNDGRYGAPPNVREASSEAALAGVNWVRDRLSWSATEPQRGEFAPHTFYDDTAREQAAAGLKVLQVFHASPPWANPDTKRHPLDLRDAYQYLKTMAARWHGQVLAWEPWNEADGEGFGGHSGVEIATYQKAAYWGLRAGNPEAIVCQNVFAQPSRTETLANFMENAPEPYFDTFNFHHYIDIATFPAAYAAMRPASGGKPLWISEAGTHIAWEGDETAQEPSYPEQQRQARFVTQCFAASIQEGASATFYFMLPHYVEGRTQFGLTHRDLTPRPGYLALAAAGRLLAGARTEGQVQGVTVPPHAYAMRAEPDGQPATVIVAWADNGTVTWSWPGGQRPMAVYDLLGRPVNTGGAALTVGPDPLYLLYPPSAAKALGLTAAPRGPAQLRMAASQPCPVVIQALLPATSLRVSASAYRLERREALEVPVYVYNFGSRPVTTRLRVVADRLLQVSGPTDPITIAPLQRQPLTFRVSAGQGASLLGPTTVRWTADCGRQGQTLTAVRFVVPVEELTPTRTLALKSATDPAQWRKLISPGQVTHEAAPDGVVVDATLQPGDRWVYPVLTPPAAELPPAGWDGLAFTVVPLAGQATFRAIFDEANGSSYLAGADLSQPLVLGQPYHVVILFKDCTWGAFSKPDPAGRFDPAQIRSFKIGCNTPDAHVRYLVRDVAWVKYG